MNRISIESKFVTNEFLFELKRYKELNISEELYSFLLAVEFPWKALGKPLTKFVEKCVESIPLESRIQGKVS